MLLALNSEQIPFFVVAGVFAIAAVVIGFLGIRSDRFSASEITGRVAMGGAVLLAAGTMVAAVATAEKPSQAGVQPLEKPQAPGNEPGSNAQTPPGTESGTAKPSPPQPASRNLTLAADPNALKFDTATLNAQAGRVSLSFTNPGQIPHNVTIQQGSRNLAHTPTISASKAKLTVQLKPGKYTFYCSVPGHRQAGMVGDITAK